MQLVCAPRSELSLVWESWVPGGERPWNPPACSSRPSPLALLPSPNANTSASAACWGNPFHGTDRSPAAPHRHSHSQPPLPPLPPALTPSAGADTLPERAAGPAPSQPHFAAVGEGVLSLSPQKKPRWSAWASSHSPGSKSLGFQVSLRVEAGHPDRVGTSRSDRP